MSFLKWIRVQYGQRVVVYRDAQPVELLRPGRYLRVAIGGGLEIERFSTRDPWVATNMLPEIVRAGLLEGEAVVLDLVDRERAIVRIDGRYAGVKGKGVSAVWTAERKVEVEKYEVDGGPGAEYALDGRSRLALERSDFGRELSARAPVPRRDCRAAGREE